MARRARRPPRSQAQRKIDTLASTGKLTEAVITAEGLSISPNRKDETGHSENVARRLCRRKRTFPPSTISAADDFAPQSRRSHLSADGMLPRLRITELLAEVH